MCSRSSSTNSALRTLARYEAVLDLLQSHLNGYACESLSALEAALFERCYNAEGAEHRELAEIEARLARAWVERDRSFLEEILSDEWAVVDATGGIRGKREVIAEAFETSALRVDSARIEDVAIRLFGDTAVVRGRSEVAGSYDGETMAVSLRFTDVFVRRDGRWLCIASHASPISP